MSHPFTYSDKRRFVSFLGGGGFIPPAGVVLHAVSGGDQPPGADEGRSTHVAVVPHVEADLPGELPGLGVLAAHDTGRLEHAPPAV